MSYRLPLLKFICEKANIITAVMMNVFSMPGTMFLVSMKNWVVFVDFLTLQAQPQLLLIMIS